MTQATTDRIGTFRIATRDAFWLTGMVDSGPHATGREWVRAMWADFLARQDELPETLDRSVFVSPCHGRETEFTCYLGFASEQQPSHVPDGMVSILVPAHDYGVATVSGSQEVVIQAYGALPAWIVQQGRQVNREILWLELYTAPPRPIGDPIDLEIWLPLV
ncbi:MAG TPA: GyrI-like domain-containing protein [Thermomicrobiales bacterium]|nr:GyrI-like domain-containing protein [Thermomicrobiales bacterium]